MIIKFLETPFCAVNQSCTFFTKKTKKKEYISIHDATDSSFGGGEGFNSHPVFAETEEDYKTEFVFFLLSIFDTELHHLPKIIYC